MSETASVDGVVRITTLRADLKIHGVAWSPDGRLLAYTSGGSTIIHDPRDDKPLRTFSEGESANDVDWAPDGTCVASCDLDEKKVHIWPVRGPLQAGSIYPEGHVWAVAWSPNGRLVATGLQHGPCDVRIWDIETLELERDCPGHSRWVLDLEWSPDGSVLASASVDKTVRLWDAQTGESTAVLEHPAGVSCLAWSATGDLLATGADDGIVRLWKSGTGSLVAELEGHAAQVYGVSFSADGRVLASQSMDGTVRLWAASGISLGILAASTGGWSGGIAFHPSNPLLVTRDEKDKVLHIWRVDIDQLLQGAAETSSVRYVTAKIPLVGDQQVGKTTLGHRLITGEFKLFPRTHGQQFWTFPSLSTRRSDGTECEAILWDLAGQADYRLTHSLFLDDAHLALVLFNASDRQEPLKGVEYWLKLLRNTPGAPCATILVAAQKDTGDVNLTAAELEAFCRTHGVTGGYVVTSAFTGEGVDTLLERVREQVAWDSLPATVTIPTFKRIKEFVLAIKARDQQERLVLLTPTALRSALEEADPLFTFSESEMMTAVGHLANHGFVTILRTSSGDRSILLMPDLLINLTASIVLEARSNTKGLGALTEADVLAGRVAFRELEGLSVENRGTLLDAAVALFLQHNVCFRATIGTETLLVFPALIHQRKPQVEAVTMEEDVSYTVSGAVEHLYSALVVLLGYTNMFTRTNQWHNQAEYETALGQICGFRQVTDRDGETTLVLLYAKGTQSSTRSLFEGLFETFLLSRNVQVTKFPAVSCPKCGYRQERDEIVKRVRMGVGFVRCAECGRKIDLPTAAEQLGIPESRRAMLQGEREIARRRTAYETAISHVKGLVRDTKRERKPSCFVSYAWGVPAHERFVAALVQDLLTADLEVVFDQKDNAAIGKSVARFLSDGIESSDYVIVVGTPAYADKYRNRVSAAGSIVAAEVDLIHLRLTGTEERKETVLPVLLDGEPERALPPLVQGRVRADFRDPGLYFVALFDLVLTLHAIAVDDPAVADLRSRLRDAV